MTDSTAQATNENDANVIQITEDGGVIKKVLQHGAGDDSPEQDDDVRVLYIGRLVSDKSVFDQNQDRDHPFTFPLGKGRVIKGWDKAVATMKKGERALVTLQPDYAYGEHGSPPKIPANAALEFEIELLGWKSANALTDDGKVTLKMIHRNESEWKTVADKNEVVINFVAKMSGEAVYQQNDFSLTIGENDQRVLPMMETALKKMKKGEKAILHVTSEHAYGATGNPEMNIPPNADIDFELELVKIIVIEDVYSGEFPGNVWKKTLNEGEGWEQPKDGAKVTVTIQGKTIDGVEFLAENQMEVVLGNGELPEAVEGALEKMKKGEYAEIRANKDFGWGLSYTQKHNIPADKDFVFHVKLIEFEKGKESWDMNNDEKLEDANKGRESGNVLFKDGKIRSAIRKYKRATKAFEYEKDLDAEFDKRVKQMKLPAYLNLAACYLKLKDYVEVIKNTGSALEIEHNNPKALYRRAQARFFRQEYELAKEDCTALLEKDSSLTEVKEMLKRIQAKINEQTAKERKLFGKLFEKVTFFEESKTAASSEEKVAEGDDVKMAEAEPIQETVDAVGK